MNWSYIAGYFDGEGSLLFNIGKERRGGKVGDSYVGGWNIAPSLSLTSFDYEALKDIGDYIGERGFRVYSLETKKKREGQTKGAYRLSIFGWDNINKVLRYLKPHSIVKREQFEKFKELYTKWKSRPFNPHNYYHKRTWTKDTFIEAMGIVDTINSLKSRKRGKMNQQFFINLWRNNANEGYRYTL